jgi:membrane-bound ClpP family serine protease
MAKESARDMIHRIGEKAGDLLKKRHIPDWLKIILLLLDDAAVLLVIVLFLVMGGIQIPLPIIIFLSVLAAAFVYITNKLILADFRRKPVTGHERMTGLEAIVTKRLSPQGTVFVLGENWKAVSLDDNIELDEIVEIVEVDRLLLRVRRKGKTGGGNETSASSGA